MTSLTFWVPGKPEPQGSKTAGNRKDGTAFIRDKNPKGLKLWRTLVSDGIRSQFPDWWEMGLPISVGVKATMTFWMPRPKDRSKTIDVPCTVRPDIDKLARAVMDSMTTSHIIKDDALVYDLHPVKRYAIDPDLLPRIYIPGEHREVPGVDIRLTWDSDSHVGS